MTGLYHGIGAAIALSLILLAYVPFISIAFLWETGMFNGVRKQLRIVPVILAFLCLVALTLLIIRSAPYVALDWLLVFAIVTTAAFVIFKFTKKNIREKT